MRRYQSRKEGAHRSAQSDAHPGRADVLGCDEQYLANRAQKAQVLRHEAFSARVHHADYRFCRKMDAIWLPTS